MKKINVVTIDGPSASGKGELAKGIANHFNFKLLDSGILYRLFAYFFYFKFK
jgi:Cytidylate kinase